MSQSRSVFFRIDSFKICKGAYIDDVECIAEIFEFKIISDNIPDCANDIYDGWEFLKVIMISVISH